MNPDDKVQAFSQYLTPEERLWRMLKNIYGSKRLTHEEWSFCQDQIDQIRGHKNELPIDYQLRKHHGTQS